MGSKRKFGNCVCDNCGILFQKHQSEINRNLKLNRQNFCTRTCAGKKLFKNFGDGKNRYDLSKHSGNLRDELTPFRYHLRNIRNRDKEFNLDLQYLKKIWEEQNGICPFTDIKLILNGYRKIKNDPRFSASLDRIDNTKGYIIGNVRWVSRSINLMKNQITDDELIYFLELISQKYKKDGNL